MPPRDGASSPYHDGVKVCVSEAEVMDRRMLASSEVDVASVWVESVWYGEYCAPKAVMPTPDEPASTPQANCPVAEFQMSLPVLGEQLDSPAPKM